MIEEREAKTLAKLRRLMDKRRNVTNELDLRESASSSSGIFSEGDEVDRSQELAENPERDRSCAVEKIKDFKNISR